MKFVALALTILFAAGSQARVLSDAPPSQLDHVRAAVGVYLAQVKETAEKALGHLDDTEYKQYKRTLSQSLDRLEGYIKSTSQTLAPYTDAFSAQFMEMTKQLRENVMSDVDMLKKQLAPKTEELKQVIQKHLEEYREKLEPSLQEYLDKHKQEAAALKEKMQPVLEELKTKFQTNVEETKSKLIPILDAVRSKLTERLEELKTMATPYVDEYKEHLIKALEELKNATPKLEELQGKAGAHAEDLKAKLMALWEAISKGSQA
ncbi:apolipoprotein A-I-1-like [Megalops cyprinoides]|uniref:apolipoprotein A-I-1-like n=1 Tax=Megalops cyprinoides TaxID=118141 RepID=UPI0018654863|nr:apolipoprotein A-I-1-like [Megalops cyprinoides]